MMKVMGQAGLEKNQHTQMVVNTRMDEYRAYKSKLEEDKLREERLNKLEKMIYDIAHKLDKLVEDKDA